MVIQPPWIFIQLKLYIQLNPMFLWYQSIIQNIFPEQRSKHISGIVTMHSNALYVWSEKKNKRHIWQLQSTLFQTAVRKNWNNGISLFSVLNIYEKRNLYTFSTQKKTFKKISALDDNKLTTNINGRHNTKIVLLANKNSEMPDIRWLAKGIYIN